MSKAQIRVGKRFQRSINLEADFRESSAIRGFVVSPLAWETLCRIVHGLASPNGNQAWALVGPYGSGKSSFAAFLVNAIGTEHRRAAQRKIKDSWEDEAKDFGRTLKGIGEGLIPVPIVGERAPLALMIVRGLERAMNEHWSSRGRRPAFFKDMRGILADLERERPVADSAIVELILSVAAAIQRATPKGDGLALILDEFGKTLEWSAQHPEQTDLYLLQLLAEAANRDESARFLIITIQHQGIEAYADRLSVQQQREWEKVGGRFESVPYLESPRHLTKLVAEAIEQTVELDHLRSYKSHAKAVRALERASSGDLPVDDLGQCYPLHPAAALTLGPIFRLDLGQNERSLFSFLSSREPLGFQEYLTQWHGDPEGTSLFGLGNLYDYVLANTRALLSTGPDSRIWRTAEEAIHRLPKDAGEEEEQIIKAVALLTLVGPTVGLSANEGTLAVCLGLSKKKAANAIKKLEDSSVLLFRQFKASYQLWDGSDLDVGSLLEEGRIRVAERGDLAAQISAVHSLAPFLAARNYLETGTLRTFECRFVSANDHVSLQHYSGNADGLIAIVLPEQNALTQEALEGTQTPGKPLLSLHLVQDSPLTDSIVEFLAAREALSSTSELENDPIARRALEDFRLSAWDRLQEQLTRAFHGKAKGVWHQNGMPEKKVSNLSELATKALQDSYKQTPEIHNELLNRAHLSSAAAAARRELLERLLSSSGKVHLGIEGFPPELSMYLSVIEKTKMHRPNYIDGAHPGLARPPKSSALRGIWNHLDKIFKNKKSERIALSEIYAEFSEPPFGVRQGILPVILFCYLLVNQDTAFLYEDGSFVPAIEKDHIQRFLSRPHTFQVQKLAMNKKDQAALAATAKALGIQSDKPRLLETVKALIQSAGDLSAFARQTQRITREARNLRAALFSARDPISLIRNEIPSAFGLEGSPKGIETELVRRLKKGLRELRLADAKLVKEIHQSLLQAFGRGSLGAVSFSQLRDRANAIDLEAFPVQPLSRIVVTFSMLSEKPTDEWFRQVGLALVGKPVLQWRDEDLPIFRSVLFDAARQFAAAEAGSTDLAKHKAEGSGEIQLTSIAWLTNEGSYDTAVAHITPALQDRVSEAMPALRATAAKYSIDLRELLAAALVADSPTPQNLEDSKTLQLEV